MADPSSGSSEIPARQIAAVALGNAIVFFDFLSYAFFAVYIGRTFFPSNDPTTSLLASLAAFGVGFVTRPIGALVLGRLGDRVGRRRAMSVTFSLMGGAMLGLALTPSYDTIGLAAPIIAILFRLIQGFALGGELGASTAYLVEAAPLHRRGLYVSLQFMGQDTSVLIAGSMGALLATILTEAQLTTWGWRIPFIMGAVIIPFGLLLRRSLIDTMDTGSDQVRTRPPFRDYSRVASLGLVLLAAGSVAVYVLTYLTTYSIATLRMPSNVAFGATVAVGASGVIFDPIAGLLSDRWGRRRLVLISWACLVMAVLPAFLAIAHFRSAQALYVAAIILQILYTMGATSVLVSVTESLPKAVRCGSLALVYALAISVFGGTTQFVVTWLIKSSGSPLAPAWYMVGAITIGFCAMLAMRETAPRVIKESRQQSGPANFKRISSSAGSQC